MSVVRKQYNIVMNIFTGSEKSLTITVEDPVTGEPKNLTDTSKYNSGNVKIIKPDGTVIATLPIVYLVRLEGVVEFLVPDTVTSIENAGNWFGKLQLIDDSSKIVEQQVFNFNIISC